MRNKNFIRWAFITVGIIALLLLGGNVFLHYWLNRELPGILNQSENRAYDIRYEECSINWMTQKLSIDGIVINPHHQNTDTLREDSSGIRARIDRFVIENVSLGRLVFHKELRTTRLSIVRPQLQLTIGPDKKTSGDTLQSNIFLRDIFNRIRVKNIELKDGFLTIRDIRKPRPLLEFGPFQLRLKEMMADTATIASPFPFRYQSVYLEGDSVVYRFSPYYVAKVPHLILRSRELQLDSVMLQPVFSKTEFQRKVPYQQDWYRLVAGRITTKQISWGFVNDKLFIAINSMQLSSTDFHIYRDKRKPYPPFKKKPLFGSFLHSLPFRITVDSLETKDLRITYEEHPNAERESGKVVFDKISSRGFNITNDSARLRQNAVCEVNAQGFFMNASPLKATFRFQLDDPGDKFKVTAALGRLKSEVLNQVLKPLAGITATGEVRSLDITIEGGDISAANTMRFLYDSLQLSIFNKEGDRKNKLLTAITNIFVHHKNLPQEEKYQRSSYRFARFQDRSFFNYLWNCIKTGAANTLMHTGNSRFKKKQLDRFLKKSVEKQSSGKK